MIRTVRAAWYEKADSGLVPIPGMLAFAYRLIRATQLPDGEAAVAKRLLCWLQLWFADAEIGDKLVDLNTYNVTGNVDVVIDYTAVDGRVRRKRFRRVIFGYGGGSYAGSLEEPVDDGQAVTHWMPALLSMPPAAKLADYVITEDAPA